jgi:hypothetical protein
MSGEGYHPIFAGVVTTDHRGSASASAWLINWSPITPGWFISTNVTFQDGHTTEFGNCVPVKVDSDNDTIEDAVDLAPFVGSQQFSDGTTSGSIVAYNGNLTSVIDVAPGGVVVAANYPATAPPVLEAQFSLCGGTAIVNLTRDRSSIQTCGSITMDVHIGPLNATFGTMPSVMPSGALSTTVEPSSGVYDVSVSASSERCISFGRLAIGIGVSQTGLTDANADGIVDGVPLDNDADCGWFGGKPAWIADGTSPEGASTGTDGVDPNDDNNGCSDTLEGGGNHVLGGQRDPLDPWDFGDMWVPSLPASGSRSGAIAINDVLAVLPWIGAADGLGPNGSGRDYDDDSNANGVDDGAEYDRTPGAMATPWKLGPPSGSVSISDALAVLGSIGDHC